MAVDLSGIAFFLPIVSFLLVMVVVFAVLKKTEILGESKFIQLLIAFLLATLFVTVGSVRQYVETITPWFAVLLVSLVFLLALIGLVGKKTEFMTKGIGILAVIVLIIVFLVSGIFVFGNVIAPYLPGGTPDDAALSGFTGWLYSGPVLGAIILLVVAGVVSWVLTKK
jgi:hypothetical protein